MRNSIAFALTLALCGSASAHITVSAPQAVAGGRTVATFRVGHGCSGSATTALKIEIPQDILSVRPEHKAGWTIAMDHQQLATPLKGDMGETVTERTSAVTWTGGSIPGDEYDEFSVLLKLPATPGQIVFPATQTCGRDVEHWSGADKAHPAPTLTVTAGQAADDFMHGMDMSGMKMGASALIAAASIHDAWFRALPSGLPAGGYFTLHNDGSTELTLTSASSPACGMLMLHKSENNSGTSSMADVTSVDVPTGKSIAFAPGGYHLMCMQPTSAMAPGGKVNVTLGFSGGSKLDADFAVRNAAGK